VAKPKSEGDLDFIYKPKSKSQKEAEELWRRSRLLFMLGPAGTGKSLAALAMAVRDALTNLKKENGPKQKLWLARPAVFCGDNLGYLPGDLTEKVGAWMSHFQDCFESLSTSNWQVLEKVIKVELVSVGLIRGRTIRNGTLICDEMQNASFDQLKAIVTRLGENSRICICGDPDQSDKYDPADCPLSEVARKLSHLDTVSVINFKEQLRDPLISDILDALE